MENRTQTPDNYSGQSQQQVVNSLPTNTPQPTRKDPAARMLQKASAWVLIISAILFALIAIVAVWGAFGDNSDAAWKSSASLGIIALAALVVNVGARIFEDKTK